VRSHPKIRPGSTRRADVLREERGITLVEVVVVGVLASIVMLALTAFYINSQASWVEASSQAVTQREASMVLATIADSVHVSNSATILSGSGTLILQSPGGAERCRFWVHPSDSLLHLGVEALDRGPIAASVVTRFDLVGSPTMVQVLALEMRTASGRLVRMSSGASFYNR